MKISEILRHAADVVLWDGVSERQYEGEQKFSCDAVVFSTDCPHYTQRFTYQPTAKALAFLKSLGVGTEDLYEFDKFKTNESRQGARFLWLDFAALVAEDMEARGEL